MEKQIAADLKKKFEIFQVYDISWSADNFASNLARFYGKNLPQGLKKETGTGIFRMYLVYDKNPQLSGGKNLAIATCQSNYCQLTGGGSLVYASQNPQETNENLIFLFGKSTKEVELEQPHLVAKIHNQDIIGVPFWKNIEEIEEIIKKLPYTRIKPYKNAYLIHSKNADLARRIINATSRFKIAGVHKYFIDIGKSKQSVYIRKVG